MPPLTKPFYSPSETAELLGTTDERGIATGCQRGYIVCVKSDHGWRIPRKQVMKLLDMQVDPPVFIGDPDAVIE